jgi:hypothetical protein
MSQAQVSARAAIVAVFACAGLLVAALDGSAARTPPIRQKAAGGQIESFSMSGGRIAYDLKARIGAAAPCNKVMVWNALRGSTTRISGSQTCSADSTSTGAGVRELALAGGRIAWIVNQGGNTESSDHLYVSTVARPHERLVATAFRTGDVDNVLTGNWLGGLVGADNFLALDHWATNASGEVTTVHLRRVAPRLADLAEGPGTMLAKSTDGKQIAVLRPDGGSIGLYSIRGALLRTLTPAHQATEVALRGDYVAALTTADTLEVFNSHSGRRVRTWTVAHGARSLDVSNGMAVYAAPFPNGGYPRVVHVRRLKSGRDRVLTTTPPALVGVQLEPAGLGYAFARIAPNRPSTLGFVPMSRIVRMLRAG